MGATPTTWSSADAVTLAAISYRQLDYWCRTGQVAPSVAADGSGTRRQWTTSEVQALAVCGRLADAGLTQYIATAWCHVVASDGPVGVLTWRLAPHVRAAVDADQVMGDVDWLAAHRQAVLPAPR